MQENHSKIVATIGPKSASVETLRAMIAAGMNVCRINASHGDYDFHKKIINRIRRLNRELKSSVAVIYDLQGPKIRISEVDTKENVLRENQEIMLAAGEGISDNSVIYVSYNGFYKDVSAGDSVLIDDGKIELQVLRKNGSDKISAKVVHGGKLSSRKGVNLPFTKVSLPSLTEKDKNDLAFALENNVEWIGLSFVRKPEDVKELKQIILKQNSEARVIAKIEKPEALRNIDKIVEESDGIMVARGDLGVEIAMEKVPVIQKMLVRKCNQASKPIIIATQMMESMISNFHPTRAETNDVANAVFDGADALMLSGETAVGKYPVQVIKEMNKIIRICEEESSIYNRHHPPVSNSPSIISDSICYNACLMAEQSGAKAIIAMTHSGYTAFKISSQRPRSCIFIFTDNKPLVNMLSLVWGVKGFYYNKYKSTDNTILEIKNILKKEKLVHPGDSIINVASMPIHERGTSNTIKLSVMK